ncbi:hypothetical protein ANACOL_01519 [Anaerotruncus colihominis DSM 17241]|uniref:Uncharacterized protein n=1 Tax=Anaerotruncus colihominis DSM 17241 TaxID=445972 RepID=B0P9V0_9FIRM|nr:hypothetical protein ANACOL_01519 [Anaerotruncus colihominis DSM 17241]
MKIVLLVYFLHDLFNIFMQNTHDKVNQNKVKNFILCILHNSY